MAVAKQWAAGDQNIQFGDVSQAHIDIATTKIAGSVSGNVATGDGNLQIQVGQIHGNVFVTASRPKVRPRPWPIDLRPVLRTRLIGRDEEVGLATKAIASAVPLLFYGPPGAGKTELLKHVACEVPLPDELRHGVALLRTSKPLADLLQSLFDLFYVSDDVQYRPSDAARDHALQDIHALILLDDLTCSSNDIESLLDAAPNCVFVLAAQEPALWTEQSQTVGLQGLKEHDALALISRVFTRPLEPAELQLVQRLWRLADGYPGPIIKVAKKTTSHPPCTLAEAMQAVGPTDASGLTRVVLTGLPSPEQAVLSLLAAVPAALSVEHVTGITQIPTSEAALRALQARELVEPIAPGFRLVTGLGQALEEAGYARHRSAWQKRATECFISFACQRGSDAPQIVQGLEAMEALSREARGPDAQRAALVLDQLIAPHLVLSGQWEAWRLLLERALIRARSLGDRRVEAWALHEMGTRAHAVGDHDRGRQLLLAGLELRNLIGDVAGAAVTSHNITFFPWPGSPIDPGEDASAGSEVSHPNDGGDPSSTGSDSASSAGDQTAAVTTSAAPVPAIVSTAALFVASVLAIPAVKAMQPDPQHVSLIGDWNTAEFVADMPQEFLDDRSPPERWSIVSEPGCSQNCEYEVRAASSELTNRFILKPTNGGGYRGKDAIQGQCIDKLTKRPKTGFVYEVLLVFTLRPTQTGGRSGFDITKEEAWEWDRSQPPLPDGCESRPKATYRSSLRR